MNAGASQRHLINPARRNRQVIAYPDREAGSAVQLEGFYDPNPAFSSAYVLIEQTVTSMGHGLLCHVLALSRVGLTRISHGSVRPEPGGERATNEEVASQTRVAFARGRGGWSPRFMGTRGRSAAAHRGCMSGIHGGAFIARAACRRRRRLSSYAAP